MLISSPAMCPWNMRRGIPNRLSFDVQQVGVARKSALKCINWRCYFYEASATSIAGSVTEVL